MKICRYCGTQVEDSLSNCPSCDANQFSNKCANCGTVFDKGFCPNCGTRAGSKPRECPNCHTEYYSNACPNCGHIAGNKQSNYSRYDNYNYGNYPDDRSFGTSYSTAGSTSSSSGVSGQRKTWLWVLGWIFIFPLPLTLIIIKKNFKPVIKILIIAVAWVAWVSWLAVSSGATEPENTDPSVSVEMSTMEEFVYEDITN